MKRDSKVVASKGINLNDVKALGIKMHKLMDLDKAVPTQGKALLAYVREAGGQLENTIDDRRDFEGDSQLLIKLGIMIPWKEEELEEEELEEEEDPLEGLDRNGLKKYIIEQKLVGKFKIFKSDTDGQIKEKIREAKGVKPPIQKREITRPDLFASLIRRKATWDKKEMAEEMEERWIEAGGQPSKNNTESPFLVSKYTGLLVALGYGRCDKGVFTYTGK